MPVVLHPESRCDICLDAYTDTPQTWPHAISCGHIFCKSCLLSVSPAICPFCRVAFNPARLKKLHIDRWTPSVPGADAPYSGTATGRLASRVVSAPSVDAQDPDRMDADSADNPPVYRVYDPDLWDAQTGRNVPGSSAHHESHAHPPSSSRIPADSWAASTPTRNHASRFHADPWAVSIPPRNRASHAYDQSSSSLVRAGFEAAFASHPQHPPHAPEDNSPIFFYYANERYYEFSTFSSHSVDLRGKTYPTCAHLFQAHKFLPAYPAIAQYIRTLPAPHDAVREATILQWMCRADWFDVRLSIMDMILECKFTQHAHLRHLLLGTGTCELVENSPRDDFWGIGADGMGRNELGKSLMRVRQKLRSHV